MNVLRGYALPVALALGVHAGLVGLLMRNWQWEADETAVVMPQMVQARLVVLDQPAPRERPSSPPEVTPVSKPEPTPPAKPKLPDPVAKPTPEPDLEAERREREEREHLERLRQLQERSTQAALDEELFKLEDGASQADTMSYVAAIYGAIVAEWSRPPSARNDMQARFRVELVPSGDLLAVTLVDSSGNAAFDRSAEAAVRKVGRFEVPTEHRLFEAKFRRFTLLFKPEDLLR